MKMAVMMKKSFIYRQQMVFEKIREERERAITSRFGRIT